MSVPPVHDRWEEEDDEDAGEKRRERVQGNVAWPGRDGEQGGAALNFGG